MIRHITACYTVIFLLYIRFQKGTEASLKMWPEVSFKTFMMHTSVMKSSIWLNGKVKQITSHICEFWASNFNHIKVTVMLLSLC